MNDRFSNVYDDRARADAYAELEFPGTYDLAYRDLPAIISEHVNGTAALDFGCGTGRSTSFLHRLGFAPVVGVDIAEHMVARDRELDPQGAYLLVPDGELSDLPPGTFDLVLAVFTFDTEVGRAMPDGTSSSPPMSGRARPTPLKAGRCIVSLVSSPDIYINEWSSFSTKDFPENRTAGCGDKVRIVMLDVPDQRPVEDVLWTDEGYHEVHKRAGLTPLKTYRPLANEAEPHSG